MLWRTPATLSGVESVVGIFARIWCSAFSSPLLQFRPISARTTYFGGDLAATLRTRTGHPRTRPLVADRNRVRAWIEVSWWRRQGRG
jgi:hypothetical protein